MASSERPPFPRDGWADPQAEQEQLQRTQERLDEAESRHGLPPPPGPAGAPPVAMAEVYGAPPLLPPLRAPTASMYGGPPVAPAYGGPMREANGAVWKSVLTAVAVCFIVALLVLFVHFIGR